ncbi:MAG: hypothetical protein KTR28_09315 [Micavibrio sp.]|nr:hypothetical protein [Micavibrio sp.]
MLDQQTFESVNTLIKDIGDNLIQPYFKNLDDSQIFTKTSATDLVSVADREAEIALSKGLTQLLEGSLFFGEEGFSADENIIANITQTDKPVWIVDPIDGTRNFVHGKDGFGIMCALYFNGKVQASWLYEVASHTMTSYKLGDNVVLNGEALQNFTAPNTDNLLGRGGFAFLNKAHLDEIAHKASDINIDPAGMPSIMIYDRLLRSELDFLVFKRTHAWDHVPPCAMVEALGGCALNWSGKPYLSNIHRTTDGLIVARDKATADKILNDLITPMLALAKAS